MRRRGVLRLLGGLLAAPLASRAVARVALPAGASAIPYPRVETNGAGALAEWERLRLAGKGWPVIIGDDQALALVGEQFGAEGNLASVESILEAARKVRLPRDLYGRLGTERLSDEDKAALAGEWPSAPPESAGLTVTIDLQNGKPFERVHILLIPTDDGAEVPAYLRWGGWNECPDPAMHVAVLRDWHARYGVELVGLGSDVMNLRAQRRPATRDAALGLATEQYFYCIDIVEQGVGSTSALAAALMTGDWWFFWWD